MHAPHELRVCKAAANEYHTAIEVRQRRRLRGVAQSLDFQRDHPAAIQWHAHEEEPICRTGIALTLSRPIGVLTDHALSPAPAGTACRCSRPVKSENRVLRPPHASAYATKTSGYVTSDQRKPVCHNAIALTFMMVGLMLQLHGGLLERKTAVCSPITTAPFVLRIGMAMLLPGSRDGSAHGPSMRSCTNNSSRSWGDQDGTNHRCYAMACSLSNRISYTKQVSALCRGQ